MSYGGIGYHLAEIVRRVRLRQVSPGNFNAWVAFSPRTAGRLKAAIRGPRRRLTPPRLWRTSPWTGSSFPKRCCVLAEKPMWMLDFERQDPNRPGAKCEKWWRAGAARSSG